jgi:hypothetical protein
MVLALVGTLAVMAPQRALATPVLTTGSYHMKNDLKYVYRTLDDYIVDVTSVDLNKGSAQMTIKTLDERRYPSGESRTASVVTKPITLDMRRGGTVFPFTCETERGTRGKGEIRVITNNVIQVQLEITDFQKLDMPYLWTGRAYVCNKGNSLDGVMCRMYNRKSGEHFYTGSILERNNLLNNKWLAEGAAWKSPTKSNTPVYRLYNANAGEHHYTMSKVERDHLVQVGWKDEGIGWYSDDAKGVTVYRVYNPNAYANNHHYTTSKNERDELIRLGWRNEGVAWCGQKV